MSSEIVSNFRRNRKQDLLMVHNNQCALCGYNRCVAALEFHHINKDEKLFGLSNGNCRSLESDLEESKKCILVCSNCHREIHSDMITTELVSSYDNEKAQQLLMDKQITKNYCNCCGKQITSKATLCQSCYAKLSRKVERPNRQELKKLIRTMSFLAIGRQYNVRDNTIRKWCDSYNLPRKKSEINSISNEEWEKI